MPRPVLWGARQVLHDVEMPYEWNGRRTLGAAVAWSATCPGLVARPPLPCSGRADVVAARLIAPPAGPGRTPAAPRRRGAVNLPVAGYPQLATTRATPNPDTTSEV